MQAIKCELCGSNEFTKVDGLFQCNHCNTKYTLEEAKNLMVSGTVEITKGDVEKNRLLQNADIHLKLNQFDKAKLIFLELIKEYPNDFQIYVKLASTYLQDSLLNNQIPYLSDCIKYINYSKKLEPSFDKEVFWKQIAQTHGNQLHITKEKEIDSWTNDSYVSILSMFDTALICSDYNSLPKELQVIQQMISTEYIDRLLKGELFLFSHYRSYDYADNQDYE